MIKGDHGSIFFNRGNNHGLRNVGREMSLQKGFVSGTEEFCKLGELCL